MKGGRRPGAGRPKTKPIPKVRRDVAFDVLDVINKGKSKLNPTGKAEIERWIALLDSKSEDIQIRALSTLKFSVDGKPAEKTEETIVFDPNQPLRVLIEHIGGPQNKTSTKAK